MSPAQAFKRLLVLQKGTAPVKEQLEFLLNQIGGRSTFKRIVDDLEWSVLAATKGTPFQMQRDAVKKACRTLVFLIRLRDHLNVHIADRGPEPLISALEAFREHARLVGPDGPAEEDLVPALVRWRRITLPLLVRLAVDVELVELLSQQFYEEADVLPWEIRQVVELSTELLEGVVNCHNRVVELDKELAGAKRVRAPRLHVDEIRQEARLAAVDESKLLLAAAKAGAYAECDRGRAADGPIKAFVELALSRFEVGLANGVG